jgi:hypothetical protein
LVSTRNARSIRFNPEKDKDLIEFINEKGLKPGLKFLFEYYQNTCDLKDYIDNKLPNLLKGLKFETKEEGNVMSNKSMNFIKGLGK